jgi:hypothetical protein
MRILQVVTLISPDGAYGGPARVALNPSAELIRRGHDVTLGALVGIKHRAVSPADAASRPGAPNDPTLVRRH